MAKFLVQGSYTAEGLQGVQKDKGSGRRRAIKKAVTSLGGKLEAMYFCFGDYDVLLIVDMPDNVSAAAVSLAASAAGTARIKTTPLLTVDEMDEALGKTVEYRRPGG